LITGNKGSVVAASITLIAALLLLAHIGLSVGKWVINTGSALTLFALIVLVSMPLFHILRGVHLDYHLLRLVMPSLELSNLIIFAKMIFFGLTSFEFVAIFAGEYRDPGRNIARASFIAAPIIAFLYILGTASILAYSSPEAVDMTAPIPQALSKGFHNIPILSLLAPFSIVLLLSNYIATYSLQFSANARLPLVAGWDRLLPAWFTRPSQVPHSGQLHLFSGWCRAGRKSCSAYRCRHAGNVSTDAELGFHFLRLRLSFPVRDSHFR